MISAVRDPIPLHMPTTQQHPPHRMTLFDRSTGPTAGHSLSVLEVGHSRSSSLSTWFSCPRHHRPEPCRRQDSNLLSRDDGFTARPTSPTVALLIIADRTDAWNKFPQVPIGAIYLRRLGGEKVEALNVTCPHAGCPVEYTPATNCFLCPCHDSKFNLDGSLFANAKSPSPRALDALEVEIRSGSEVWVKFQNFEAGKAKKVPLA